MTGWVKNKKIIIKIVIIKTKIINKNKSVVQKLEVVTRAFGGHTLYEAKDIIDQNDGEVFLVQNLKLFQTFKYSIISGRFPSDSIRSQNFHGFTCKHWQSASGNQ